MRTLTRSATSPPPLCRGGTTSSARSSRAGSCTRPARSPRSHASGRRSRACNATVGLAGGGPQDCQRLGAQHERGGHHERAYQGRASFLPTPVLTRHSPVLTRSIGLGTHRRQTCTPNFDPAPGGPLTHDAAPGAASTRAHVSRTPLFVRVEHRS